MYYVPILESEAGWGQKIDGHYGPFESEDSATHFAKKYNDHFNPPGPTPGWYMMAMGPVVSKLPVSGAVQVSDKLKALIGL